MPSLLGLATVRLERNTSTTAFYLPYLDGGVVAVQDSWVKVALDADVVACNKEDRTRQERAQGNNEVSKYAVFEVHYHLYS